MSGARLKGRVALVTGGLGGIGLAIARSFLAEGASVWIADLDAPGSERMQGVLAELGDAARYLRIDVTAEADWQAAAEAVGPEGLHILVNNAGLACVGMIGTADVADWRRTMAVNADGPYLGLHTLAPLLARGGAGETGWASVINISSILGLVGLSESAAYCASKGALRLLTKAAAIEFATRAMPIRVNSIHPGFVRTAMTEQGAEKMAGGADLLVALAQQTPMQRIGLPAEIAAGALFLASNESSFMTGSELVIDGGWTAR